LKSRINYWQWIKLLQKLDGKRSQKAGKMKRIKYHKAFTLIEITIVVAVIVLLVAIVIPNLLKTRMSANDSLAKARLGELSTAAESYRAAHEGVYPESFSSLTEGNPAFVNSAYCNKTLSGFTFACTFSTGNYTFTATPITVGASGTTTYTILTGGVMTP